MSIKKNYTCANCAHYGCCDDHCGGVHWEESVSEDEQSEDEEPENYPDPYDQWLHDSEVWQESMDRRF